VRIIGVGNPTRGDDGVGPAVAARLMPRVRPDVDVVVSTAEPTRLMDRWEGADLVILVDAVVADAPPGTVTVRDGIADELPPDPAALSSHGLGVAGTVELARSLGRLPAQLTVVGVVGDMFEGDALSTPVERALGSAVTAVMEVVDHA
jgi:hydrogenase maturation protease